MEDRFTFRHLGIVVWLMSVVCVTFAAVAAFGFGSWFIGAGIALVAAALLAHSGRTGEWFFFGKLPSWPTWFEGWAFSTGVLLAASTFVAERIFQWVQ